MQGKPVAGADEMLIMIRKQLSSPDVNIKRIGVLGLCAVVTEMGTHAARPRALPR